MKGHLLVQTDDVESTTNFTQQVRLELLSDLCPNGKLPTDVESARLTMSLLNSIDASTINVAKLKIEKDKTGATQENNALITELLKAVSNTQQHLIVDNSSIDTNRVLDRLSQYQIPEDNSITPGTLERGVVIDSYEDFMKRNS